MARILFNSTLGASAWAGSEVLWFQAAERLVAEGHDVAAVLPSQMCVAGTLDRLSSVGIRSLRNPLDAAFGLRVRLARRRQPSARTPMAPVVRHAKKWKADIVVFSQASCWGAYSEMLALADAGIPYVSISQLNSPFHWPGDRLFEVVGEAFARAKAAVFVSHGNLDLLQYQVARNLDNALVVYNPPSFDVSRPCGPPPTDVFRLLNVARVAPGHKGQDLVCDVLSMPKWRDRPVELEIAGGGDRKWIEALIASKGLVNVMLLGHVLDLRAVWERATFGLFPSRQEGMPLALVEGMALGRGIIATDVAGHAEWVDDGENGFLSAGTTASSLDQALERAWNERRQAAAMGAEALATFTKKQPIPPGKQLADIVGSN